jgi:hypothetical protein
MEVHVTTKLNSLATRRLVGVIDIRSQTPALVNAWKCTECSWMVPAPPTATGLSPSEATIALFIQHDCSEYCRDRRG